jgi:hypothetical protein
MTMLSELVDIVIGTGTHKFTLTAGVVTARTGAALENRTVDTDLAGYGSLVDLADGHNGERAWAIEGTRSYGSGLTGFLVELGERIIETHDAVGKALGDGTSSSGSSQRRAPDALFFRTSAHGPSRHVQVVNSHFAVEPRDGGGLIGYGNTVVALLPVRISHVRRGRLLRCSSGVHSDGAAPLRAGRR